MDMSTLSFFLKYTNTFKVAISLVIVSCLGNNVMAGPITYNICTGQCNVSVVACFTTTGIIYFHLVVASCTVILFFVYK